MDSASTEYTPHRLGSCRLRNRNVSFWIATTLPALLRWTVCRSFICRSLVPDVLGLQRFLFTAIDLYRSTGMNREYYPSGSANSNRLDHCGTLMKYQCNIYFVCVPKGGRCRTGADRLALCLRTTSNVRNRRCSTVFGGASPRTKKLARTRQAITGRGPQADKVDRALQAPRVAFQDLLVLMAPPNN